MLQHIWRTNARLTLLDRTVLWSGFVPFVLISHVKVKLSANVWCSIHWRDSFINKNKRLMMFLQARPRLHRSAVFQIEFSSSLCWGWMHQWGAWPWVTWSHNPSRPWLRHSVLHICLVWCGGHYLSIKYPFGTPYAMLTNCCVLFTGYAWSHVMCSAGTISALLFPLVCALCFSECVISMFYYCPR